jgi:hypothetical protein
MARDASDVSGISVSFVEASAEAVPLDKHSFDIVISTWTLCSIVQSRSDIAQTANRRAGGNLEWCICCIIIVAGKRQLADQKGLFPKRVAFGGLPYPTSRGRLSKSGL